MYSGRTNPGSAVALQTGTVAPLYRVEVIDQINEFALLEPVWDELLQASRADNFFLTWQWLFTWWKHESAARRLHILLVFEGRQLIGIAPLCVRPLAPERLVPWRALEFLGTGAVGSDYLDLIIRRGHERQALNTVAVHLVKTGLPLELGQVADGNTCVTELVALLRAKGWHCARREVSVCPYVDLPDSFDTFLQSLGASHRYNFRRRLRQLNKQFEVSFEQSRTSAEISEALERLIDLHLGRWQHRGGSTALHRASLRDFHHELVQLAGQAGRLRMYVLRLGDTVAATLYGFLYADKFYFYQSGFHPDFEKYSVGLVTLGLSLQSAIEDGAREFDFLHGDESYKFLWTQSLRKLVRYDLFPSAGGYMMFRGSAALKRFIRERALGQAPGNKEDEE